MGRPGQVRRSSAEIKGCADWLTSEQHNAPPHSRRRCKDCTAGVFAAAAKRSSATAPDGSLAKRAEVGTACGWRQGKENDEIRMTNDERSPKLETELRCRLQVVGGRLRGVSQPATCNPQPAARPLAFPEDGG